ncbi:uncharacterized protein V6R79_024159 [Siganus canaliculatus]
MKGRIQRSVKTGGSRRKAPSDVSPSTSLPPLVESQLRCFLRVTISRLLWTVQKPPPSTFVRLRWWGESSNGTHFFPRDGSQLSQKTIKTTTRFPIRCGPKQFTSYLTDMGSMVLEVLTKPDHLPIARAQVAGISSLSVTHPISGFYTLVSPTSEKLGELQVSLSLEALTEAYDTSSSGPVTDVSLVGPQVTLTVPSQPRALSAGSVKESAGSSGRNTPRGKDHLYFQNGHKGKEELLENQRPMTKRSLSDQDPSGQATNDLLSVILERGNKLRNAMVVSALKCDTDSAPALKDTPLPLPKENILPLSKPCPSPTGMFLQNILHADSTLKQADDVAIIRDCGLDCSADIDNRAVELLLGSLNTSPVPPWDGDGSFPGSLSGHSSVCGDSELNDPQYDQSLLENLFYKTPMSDVRQNDALVADQGTASLTEKQLTQSGQSLSADLNSEPQQSTEAGGVHSDLSAEQVSLLNMMRLARVTINSLTVPSGSAAPTPRKNSSKAKPPRPAAAKKCTYFIEYTFPVVSTSGQQERSKGGDQGLTRAVATKVAGGVVKFHQHAVFPVRLSAATVKQWWGTDLIFKIYSRRSDQKKPVPIGKAVHPLRCLLQSKQLSQSVLLPVQSLEGNRDIQELGPLKVSLELAADSRNLSSDQTKSKPDHRDTSPSQTALSPQRKTSSRTHHVDFDTRDVPAESFEDPNLNIRSSPKPSKELSPRYGVHSSPARQQQVEEDPDVLLHTLLMVPDGKNFSSGPLKAPNLYLNCKLFWCDEMARSVVSWGHANPCFNFVQVTPVALTAKLLERMRNNVMVIEVWQKSGSSGQDGLLGLVKLPLHQFYMSFRDPKIAQLLLQAQYPVLGVDCYMPVIDVFSGCCKGNLRVVLAMGRSEQILSLQRTRDEEHDSLAHLVRPVHLLDHQPHSKAQPTAVPEEAMREHVFVMRVEKINGLTPLQSTVWGEADCYVQYSFPTQESDAATQLDQTLIESSVNLKPFRTTTTLCVPDPVFGHTETHVLLAPEGVPVQRLLLSSLSAQGLSSGGGVQFEVWCRYYYPNVRDQLVAKGMLPLSKLCAMVTMQRQHPDEAQMFSLPLLPRTESHSAPHPQPSGLLDVCVRYKHRPVRPEGQAGRGAASRVVTLVVEVHRASGLQAAARVASEQDEGLCYFASVGVNTYVTVQLSFLPERERRSTRVAAKTFSPEFDHHMEVSCDLLVQRSSGETCSLAEQLEEASAVFTIWNTDSRKVLSHKAKDVMLGSVKIPLADLIHKKAGISGWFGVHAPQGSSSQHQLVLAGGLEVSIHFFHHSDRDRVLKAAQGVGWDTSHKVMQHDEDLWGERMRNVSLTFSMPRVWLPVHCLLLPGHSELQRSTYCYFRYKFYDQEAFCSQMKHPSVEEGEVEGQATVSFPGSKTVALRSTQPLMWYLREERLEVQVWVAFKKDKAQRPSDTDRLVGAAFVDLSCFAKTPKQKVTVSGVYPLFRRSAADLQGAALRVHITLHTGVDPVEDSVEDDLDLDVLSEEVEVPLPRTPRTSQSEYKTKSSRTTPDITSVQHAELSLEDSFPVTVAVDRAMHLNLKGCPLAERSEGSPCCCVSYVTADSAEPASTTVIANTDCPVWDHQHECRLSNQLLVDPQQSLVFKVWHKGDLDRVIGFASVDLSPLVCGFQSVCGWYNITDFGGQCHGQLKVSITPLRGVQDLRRLRKPVNEDVSNDMHTGLPLSYHTTATYSSFPAHISRYPEQKISSPDHTERLFSERPSDSDRHLEHMDKVRLYHKSLQEQTAAASVCSNSSGADITPSSSFLFSALRKKLSELDNIQRYFSRKLSTPTFPPMDEQDCYNKHEQGDQRDTDTSQLLQKSNQLVGEVNNIISGLRGQRLETIPSDPQSRSTTSPARDNNPQNILEISSPLRDPHFSQEEELRQQSPLPKMTEDHTDSESEEEKHRENYTEPEEENGDVSVKDDDGTGCTQHEEADYDEEEDEDYEEVVLKPRPLNEVTSLTDKTSPWTSILSDPDLVSLESLEAAEASALCPDEDEKWQMLNQQSQSRRDRSGSCSQSEGDASETDGAEERTLQPDHSTSSGSSPRGSSPANQELTQDSPRLHDSQHSPLEPSVPVEVPNFFLPSHQLEASMRAIRLAPSFCPPTTHPEQSSQGSRRGARQRRDMSPSSMKKETQRIAKIFSTHFHDNQ